MHHHHDDARNLLVDDKHTQSHKPITPHSSIAALSGFALRFQMTCKPLPDPWTVFLPPASL